MFLSEAAFACTPVCVRGLCWRELPRQAPTSGSQADPWECRPRAGGTERGSYSSRPWLRAKAQAGAAGGTAPYRKTQEATEKQGSASDPSPVQFFLSWTTLILSPHNSSFLCNSHLLHLYPNAGDIHIISPLPGATKAVWTSRLTSFSPTEESTLTCK